MVAKPLAGPQLEGDSERAPKRGDYFCVYPTLAELMTLTPFAHARLLTDAQTVVGRRVRYASVQELPEEFLVRQDEFVMTTGVGLRDDPAALVKLVREVAAAHGAAIAIAFGGDVQEDPSRIVAEAARLGVPVFEFPSALHFGEVMEASLSLVVERQHMAIHYSDDMHRLFMRTALEGGGLEQLCRIVERSFARAIRIVNASGEAFDGGPASRAGRSRRDWEATAIRIPIEGEGRPIGTLLVASSKGSLSHVEEAVARDAATAAVLLMKMERQPAAASTQGSGASVDVMSRAAALGFDPQRPYAVVRVTLSVREGDSDLGAIARSSVERALDIRQIQALQAWEGSSVTLLLPLSGPAVPPMIANLLSDINAIVRRHDPTIVVTSGVGRVIPGLANIAAGVRDASTAKTLGAIVKGPGTVTNYTDLGAYPALYHALVADASGAALADLEARYLGATIEYEASSGLPLTETLSVYFHNNGNVSATARELRINRQSLLYRLERFHQISGVDLSSRVDRFALELAVECWRLRLAVKNNPAGEAAAFTSPFEPGSVEGSAKQPRRMTSRTGVSVAPIAG